MTLRGFLQLTILAAALAWPLAAGVSEARSERTTSGKMFASLAPEAGGIRRFAEICPGLARGGEPGEEGIRYLKDHGYRTVVSFLTDKAESAAVVQSGMKYVHIPMRSSFFYANPPTDEQVRQFLSLVRDTTHYPLFMHCHAGKDRTGAMSAIYRMEVCGWTPNEAVQEMEAFGFSGRYQRLHRFVEVYAVRPGAAPLPVAASTPDSTTAEPSTASMSH
ncbi:MAG: fused DSP-PTPase phosphatase/NAD kinase-like protein [Bacteroidota bacterium]